MSQILITAHTVNITPPIQYTGLCKRNHNTNTATSADAVARPTSTSACSIICAELFTIRADAQITFTNKSQMTRIIDAEAKYYGSICTK